MQWKSGLIMAVLLTSACSGSGGDGGPTAPTAPPAISEKATVARVVVTPSTGTTKVGGAVQFVATVYDRDGNVLGPTVTWQAMNVSVAEISQNGVARGESAGTSTIQASAEGVSGSALLVVKDVEGKPGGRPL